MKLTENSRAARSNKEVQHSLASHLILPLTPTQEGGHTWVAQRNPKDAH